MILKYDQTNYKISSDGLERAIKDIKEGNKYINKLENEIIYYKIKNDKILTLIYDICENCSLHDKCPEEECRLFQIEKCLIERGKE